MAVTHKVLALAILLICPWASAAHPSIWGIYHWKVRGGEQASASDTKDETLSLDEKVRKAMQKLGLSAPKMLQDEEEECEGGACPLPAELNATTEAVKEENAYDMAARIASDMGVNKDLAMAALGATGEKLTGSEPKLNEEAARALIQRELDIIEGIAADSEDVQQLVSEGHEMFLARRALAFAEGNMEDARAILVADEMDAEEEKKAEKEALKAAEHADIEAAASSKAPVMKSMSVDANFDPTASGFETVPKKSQSPSGITPPKPAQKADVVFEATTAQIQELVLESPVPVLLDCYAPWCGPCKALTPILEEIAIKGGGAFRLVKVNTDNERPVSSALEVTALPTIYAVRDGKILNSFQGMPSGEEMMKNFLMGLLMPGSTFNPPVSADAMAKYDELSAKLAKTAGAASFSFSARERLQTRMAVQLEALVQAHGGNMADAEDSAKVVRSLISGVIRDPYSLKFRRINLENKKVASLVAAYPPCLAILKSVGFGMESSGKAMVAGLNKNVVNVSPLSVARDCIDKWIDKNRHKVAADLRKRKDEEDRMKLATLTAAVVDKEAEGDEEEDVNPDAVALKVRFEGKKKMHEIEMHADDLLSMIFDKLPIVLAAGEEFQITCVAKKLIVKSTDSDKFAQSLRSLGLAPTAAIVIKIGSQEKAESSSNLKERVAAQKRIKKGSHSMHSIGIYAKDDNVKGNLVDGGGGVMYEQEVTDDEEEGTENVEAEQNKEEDEE
jgi:thioredoxin